MFVSAREHWRMFINEHKRIVSFGTLFTNAPQKMDHGRTRTRTYRAIPNNTEQDRMVFATTACNAGHTKANFTFTVVRLGVVVAISASTALVFCSYFTMLCCGGSIIYSLTFLFVSYLSGLQRSSTICSSVLRRSLFS